MGRAFGVAAGLDPEVAAAARRPLRRARLRLDLVQRPSRRQGPGDAGRVSPPRRRTIDLGVAVIALDRTPPETIAADIERLGLDPARLWLGVGAGFSKKPLTRDARGAARAARAAARRAPRPRRDGTEDVRPRRSLLRRRLLQLDDRRISPPAPARRSTPAPGRPATRPRRSSATSAPPSAPTPPSAWPRRSPSTATSTTATATTSTASASPRARSASPPPTPRTPRPSSPPTPPSTRSSSAASPAPGSSR